MNKNWHFTRLSAVQIKQLCTMAGQARIIAKTRFDERAEVDAESWRKWGQDEATGVKGLSLRKATQVHYLPIRGFWFNLLGNCEQAFNDYLNSGEQNEAMREIKWRLAGEVSRLADGIKAEKARGLFPVVITDEQAAKEAWNYTHAVCPDKFQGRRLSGLNSPEEIEQLCTTIFNRASAKLGVGKAENRNKSQRAGQAARRKSKPVEAEVLEPFERSSSRAEEPVEIELTEPLGSREPLPF